MTNEFFSTLLTLADTRRFHPATGTAGSRVATGPAPSALACGQRRVESGLTAARSTAADAGEDATERLGKITSIHRYPVKSMGGERLAVAPLTLQGIALDRMYAFVQAGSKSPFPWLTGREVPAMLFYGATVAPGQPPSVTVRTPAGAEFAADAPALLAELEALAKGPVHLLPNYRGSFDVAPVSVIASSTVAGVATATSTRADPLRFRMNFLIDTGGAASFVENAWVGRILRLGQTARIAVTEPDKRCVMVTLEHPAGAASPAVLRAVADANGAAAGVYATVLAPGEVREGDEAWIE